MSRVLAQLMGAAEPAFRAQIQRLEQAAGMPSADIRLTMEVVNGTKAKIRELGLDPNDTTGPELYRALQTRLTDDEQRVREALGLDADASPEACLTAIKHFLEKQPLHTDSFAVKQSVMRQLLKKLQPKSTMKKLGYRSLDSMLKHEPIAQLLAATLISESHDWHKRRLEAYKKLQPHDFEVKPVSYFVPTTKHWPAVAAKYTAAHRQNIMVLPEQGAVVLLPVETVLPALAITTLLLAVEAVNDIRSRASYLKLQQVRPDFGNLFVQAVSSEPMADTELAGQQLPWKAVQWFYGRGHSAYHPEAFQPHVQPEDLAWHDAEPLLTGLHGALEFWEGNQLLALLDQGRPISLNLLDVSLSVCNGLDYAHRVVQHLRENLGRELLARYLHQENLQAFLVGSLDRGLVPEEAFDA